MIIVEEPAVDFVTMTTFEKEKYEQAREIIASSRYAGTIKETKKMQYVGYTFGNMFAGSGEQQGLPHYMVQVTGGGAQLMFPSLNPLNLNPTRVDVQITLSDTAVSRIKKILSDEKKWRDTDSIPTFLNHAYKEWKWSSGRKKKTNVITQDGKDTLYIGGREKSRLFARVYMKELAEGKLGIRYELELKLDAAKKFCKQVRDGDDLTAMCTRALLDEVKKYPSKCPLRSELIAILENWSVGEMIGLYMDAVSKDSLKTLQWLRDSVAPAVNRLLNDHDVREKAIHWIVSMNALAGINEDVVEKHLDKG